jgi:hypothetical protein
MLPLCGHVILLGWAMLEAVKARDIPQSVAQASGPYESLYAAPCEFLKQMKQEPPTPAWFITPGDAGIEEEYR